MHLKKVNNMYTEPSLLNLLDGAAVVSNYGTQTTQGYMELQVYTGGKDKDYILVVQSREHRGLLAFLPSGKLKWHSIAAQERYRIQSQRAHSERAKAMYYKSAKDGLYIEAYTLTLNSRVSYYHRLAQRLHSTLQDYAESGKPFMQQLDLEFIKTLHSKLVLPVEFMLFVLAKVQEHYAPQRFDKLPRFKREFCRTLQYRLEQANVPAGEELERAMCIGATGLVGGR